MIRKPWAPRLARGAFARAAVDTKAGDAADTVKTAIAIIDSAVSKGILKRQTASRYVSRLATRRA